MRTAAEIANEIADVRKALNLIGYVNVANVSVEKLAEIEQRRMEYERKMYLLERERQEWVWHPIKVDG